MMPPSGPELTDISCACLIVLDGWGIAPAGPGNACFYVKGRSLFAWFS